MLQYNTVNNRVRICYKMLADAGWSGHIICLRTSMKMKFVDGWRVLARLRRSSFFEMWWPGCQWWQNLSMSMSGENAPFQIDVSGKTRWVWTWWSDMTDSGLPRFLAIHFLFQGSQAQRERLRAIFIPSSCSNLYSSTSVRTSEFAIHPWTWGSAIPSVTSQFFLWQYTKSNIMREHSWKFRLHLRSEQDAEEGDVIAWWSQSERALRGAYGPNLHSTLASNDGRHWA